MWKLTIEQKKKYYNSDMEYTSSVEFVAKEIDELTLIIGRLSRITGEGVTYSIEKVGEANE